MTTTHDLANEIDLLIRKHVAALHATVAEAVSRAFATAAHKSVAPGKAAAPGGAANAKTAPTPRRAPAPRRALEHLAALAERLDAAVRAAPGETMATLAPKVGSSARELHVVAARLRRANRLRTVGQRQYTRYFPGLGDDAQASA